MKRIIATTALVLATASSALAMSTPADTLSAGDLFEARIIVPTGDFSNLTVAQAGLIAAALHDQDGQTGARIRSILAN